MRDDHSNQREDRLIDRRRMLIRTAGAFFGATSPGDLCWERVRRHHGRPAR